MTCHAVAIEQWNWPRTCEVKMWLVNNFGVNGGRWGEDYDYGLENLWMDKDVYVLYLLRWGT